MTQTFYSRLNWSEILGLGTLHAIHIDNPFYVKPTAEKSEKLADNVNKIPSGRQCRQQIKSSSSR